MKRFKLFAIICSICMLTSNLKSMTVFADETTVPEYLSTVEDGEKATGLIMSFSLQISSSYKKIYLTGTTLGTETMAKIGFKNIEVQRSSNGSTGWTKEFDLSDDLATDKRVHYKDEEQHSVSGGYYYRVKLDHYAKETGWFFPSSQSVTNYSNVIWVSG